VGEFNKVILVTGASGFIGQYLMRELTDRYGQHEVIGLVSSPMSTFRFHLHMGYHKSALDFVSWGMGGIQTVIHAGASMPTSSVDLLDPASAKRSTDSTERLLQSNFPNIKRFIYLSSIDVYGNGSTLEEARDVMPPNPYARSKLECEASVNAWGLDRGVITQILRIGHTYGAGEGNSHKVIPNTFRALSNGESPIIYGSGLERRAFIYAADVAQAVSASIDLDETKGPINVASPHSVTIRETVEACIQVSDKEVDPLFVESSSTPYDVVPSTEKMSKLLGTGFTPFRIGLEAEWASVARLGQHDRF
jgi:nucleoside-diphosphate-sugar epimerase